MTLGPVIVSALGVDVGLDVGVEVGVDVGFDVGVDVGVNVGGAAWTSWEKAGAPPLLPQALSRSTP